jgi:hypothetical protein
MGVMSKSKEKNIWNIGNETESSALLLYFFSVAICSAKNLSKLFNENDEFKLADNSIFDMKVDCEKKTIYYFINKKQCPYYISDISSFSFPLVFGFSSCALPIIEVISIYKSNKSDSCFNSSLKCEAIKWVSIFFNFI